MALKIKGVTYDVGMPVIRGGMTRETLPPDVVEREMRIIRRELNCNAVRITGREIGRLETAAHIAAEQGLEVWLSPMRHDADERETFDGVMRAARVCEELRKKRDVRVVLVIGCELSVFMAGLIPGNNAFERLALLSDPSRWTEELFAQGSPIERLNGFLARTQAEAEKRFSGPITYAAGLWEDIDWSRFDFVGIDAYRDAGNAGHFRDILRKYKEHGKPVVVTEFGCCTYAGAENAGSMGWNVIDRNSRPWRLRKPLVRDEDAQANHLTELIALFEDEALEGAFVFTFVSPSYPSSENPEYDLDTASFSIVRTWEQRRTSRFPLEWEPKKAFHAIARYYGGA